MADDLLQRAILKIKTKLRPAQKPEAFIPEDQYKSLYNDLEIFGSDRDDTDVQEKTKWIHEFLKDNYVGDSRFSDVQDALMEVFHKIGHKPGALEPKIDRVYKFLRFRAEAKKAYKKYQHYQEEANSLTDKDEKDEEKSRD